MSPVEHRCPSRRCPQRTANTDQQLPAARRAVPVIACVALLFLAGCQTSIFMPAPNLYVNSSTNPFDTVPAELRQNEAKIVYVTDRVPVIGEENAALSYGYLRSGSLGGGVSTVEFGEGLDWPALVEASLASRPGHLLEARVTGRQELFRFPDSNLYAKANREGSTDEDELARSEKEATSKLHELIHERLEYGEGHDAYVFIHGYNSAFDDAVITMAQLWHYLGRTGVPIVYSWPAGGKGALGYTNDIESGEFTIWHLKRFLAALASSPDIERIHLIAHSRGCNVVLEALRELHLFNEGAGIETQTALKLGDLILAAPDLDLEVATQRILPEGLLAVPSRMTIYVSEKDRAMGFTTWLFGGLVRLGKLTRGELTYSQRGTMDTTPSFDLINARIKRTDWYGHSYFYQSPAVSSDVILVLRDDLDPGKENGRPLRQGPPHYWFIDDDYPVFDQSQSLPE